MTLTCAIGLMSGTSMDGIDLAMLRTDGENVVERGPSFFVPYDAAFRRRLETGLEDAKLIVQREERPGELAALETDITLRHARRGERVPAPQLWSMGRAAGDRLPRPDRPAPAAARADGSAW